MGLELNPLIILLGIVLFYVKSRNESDTQISKNPKSEKETPKKSMNFLEAGKMVSSFFDNIKKSMKRTLRRSYEDNILERNYTYQETRPESFVPAFSNNILPITSDYIKQRSAGKTNGNYSFNLNGKQKNSKNEFEFKQGMILNIDIF